MVRRPCLSNFTLLRGDNALRHFPDGRILAVLQFDTRHVDGALMMRDHALHEIAIRIAGERDAHALVHRIVRLGVGLRRGGMRGHAGAAVHLVFPALRDSRADAERRDGKCPDDDGCFLHVYVPS